MEIIIFKIKIGCAFAEFLGCSSSLGKVLYRNYTRIKCYTEGMSIQIYRVLRQIIYFIQLWRVASWFWIWWCKVVMILMSHDWCKVSVLWLFFNTLLHSCSALELIKQKQNGERTAQRTKVWLMVNYPFKVWDLVIPYSSVNFPYISHSRWMVDDFSSLIRESPVYQSFRLCTALLGRDVFSNSLSSTSINKVCWVYV